jgi:hypothetical protein
MGVREGGQARRLDLVPGRRKRSPRLCDKSASLAKTAGIERVLGIAKVGNGSNPHR